MADRESGQAALRAGLLARSAERARAETAMAGALARVRACEQRLAEALERLSGCERNVQENWPTEGSAALVAALRAGLSADVEAATSERDAALSTLDEAVSHKRACLERLDVARARELAIERAIERKAAEARVRRDRRDGDE